MKIMSLIALFFFAALGSISSYAAIETTTTTYASYESPETPAEFQFVYGGTKPVVGATKFQQSRYGAYDENFTLPGTEEDRVSEIETVETYRSNHPEERTFMRNKSTGYPSDENFFNEGRNE